MKNAQGKSTAPATPELDRARIAYLKAYAAIQQGLQGRPARKGKA